MIKKVTLGAALAVSFGLGFGFRSIFTESDQTPNKLNRVTGIGGVFFKSKDPKKLSQWYSTHLGLKINPYGSVFEWYQGADSTKKGFTQWSPFAEKTTYFEPSTKDFMINYRVQQIELLVAELKQNGVTVLDSIETFEYGKFVHLLDIEGNKIELWEPNDVVYEKMGVNMGFETTK